MADDLNVPIRLIPEAWKVPEGWELRPGETPTFCRSCHAPVLWFAHETSGKRAPFNPDGVSHFATCPQAASWRKRDADR